MPLAVALPHRVSPGLSAEWNVSEREHWITDPQMPGAQCSPDSPFAGPFSPLTAKQTLLSPIPQASHGYPGCSETELRLFSFLVLQLLASLLLSSCEADCALGFLKPYPRGLRRGSGGKAYMQAESCTCNKSKKILQKPHGARPRLIHCGLPGTLLRLWHMTVLDKGTYAGEAYYYSHEGLEWKAQTCCSFTGASG